jgi:3-deoxy-manno-octulosonate cytidylyltransferase (CMP-KDO synthetase)
MIDHLIAGMQADPSCVMGTLARKINAAEQLSNPNVVKVVVGANGNALYFSRSQIPYVRDAADQFRGGTFLKHLGIYGFQREFLLKFVGLVPGELEKTEKLEQLRALENGYPIKVLITPHDSIGVDRPEDVKLVEEILRAHA